MNADVTTFDYDEVIKEFIKSMKSDYEHEMVTEDADWFMKTLPGTNKLIFNDNLKDVAGNQYFTTILVHETFHAIRQGIPNKEDVKSVKAVLGDSVMLELDIEADYYTAEFFQEKYGVTIDEFIGFLYDGRETFKSSGFHQGKFERFLGSLVTLINYKNTKQKALFFLRFNLHTIGNQVVVKITRNYLNIANCSIPDEKMDLLKKLYQEPESFTKEEYVSRVNEAIEELRQLILTNVKFPD